MSSLQEKYSGKHQVSALSTAKTAIKAANAYNANKAATAFTAGTPVATSASGGTVLANQTTIPMTGSGGPQVSSAAADNTGAYVSAAVAAHKIYGIYGNDNLTAQEQGRLARREVGLAVADYYTAGLARPVYALADSKWGGTIDKLENIYSKYTLAGRIDDFVFKNNRLI